MIRVMLKSIATASLALSFLSLSTAIYNPEFHSQLHSHTKSTVECHGHKEASEESHDANASCHICSIQSHIAAHNSPSFQIQYDLGSFTGSIQNVSRNIFVSEFFLSLSGRAPPVIS